VRRERSPASVSGTPRARATSERSRSRTDSAKVCTVAARTGLFTSASHGLTADQVARFEVDNGSIPTGLSAGIDYYVLASGLTANDFKVSATLGGAAVIPTVLGTGTLRAFLSYAQPVGNNTTVTVPANGLVFQLRTAV
jgi:hypothetical protein